MEVVLCLNVTYLREQEHSPSFAASPPHCLYPLLFGHQGDGLDSFCGSPSRNGGRKRDCTDVVGELPDRDGIVFSKRVVDMRDLPSEFLKCS